jgi:hypothetical protein
MRIAEQLWASFDAERNLRSEGKADASVGWYPTQYVEQRDLLTTRMVEAKKT